MSKKSCHGNFLFSEEIKAGERQPCKEEFDRLETCQNCKDAYWGIENSDSKPRPSAGLSIPQMQQKIKDMGKTNSYEPMFENLTDEDIKKMSLKHLTIRRNNIDVWVQKHSIHKRREFARSVIKKIDNEIDFRTSNFPTEISV